MLASMLAGSTARADSTASSQPSNFFCNPLDVLLADPFIYREGDIYYLYATSSERGFVVWTSKDLVNWQSRGYAFTRTADTWSRQQFWAPEMFAHNGKYYLHFTVMGRDKGGRRIVLAEGTSPLGPFKEIKAPWFDPGKGTIDSHVFKDTDGKLYLYSVDLDRDDRKCFEIHARRVSDDLVPQKEFTFCITPSQEWEGRVVNEGPFVFKHGETYVLTYSANGYFDPNYSVGMATSKSPMGPWTKQPDPILWRNKYVSGPGHHCFIDSPDGKELFIAYHTHQHLENPSGQRQLAIDRVRLVDSRALAMKVDGPTTRPVPMPSGAQHLVRGQSDEFSAAELDRRRWNVFSERSKFWSLEAGHLTIRTEAGDVYQDRSDLHNLFLQHAPVGDFTATTLVKVKPQKGHEQAFLTVWQNHNQFAKLAIVQTVNGLKYEVAREMSGKYSFNLHDAPQRDGYWLRIGRRGSACEYSVSEDGSRWIVLASHQIDLDNPRVGLGACSPESDRSVPVKFDFLRF